MCWGLGESGRLGHGDEQSIGDNEVYRHNTLHVHYAYYVGVYARASDSEHAATWLIWCDRHCVFFVVAAIA
jgi:hypothetical protein